MHQFVLRVVDGEHVKELKQTPTQINEQDAMGRTALLWAAARGEHQTVYTLLRLEADPNIMDCRYSGPLSYAASQNHTACVQTLLAAGADPDPIISSGSKIESPLNRAACNASDPLLIRALLDHGANVDAVCLYMSQSVVRSAVADGLLSSVGWTDKLPSSTPHELTRLNPPKSFSRIRQTSMPSPLRDKHL